MMSYCCFTLFHAIEHMSHVMVFSEHGGWCGCPGVTGIKKAFICVQLDLAVKSMTSLTHVGFVMQDVYYS